MTIDTRKFWRNPTYDAIDNRSRFAWYQPEFYLSLYFQTGLIVDELSKHLDRNASILELGCGGGRNLFALKQAGFTRLSGIEINPDAILLGKQRNNMSGIDMICSAIEDADIPEVDCIFTHGVLMHLPPESEFVFQSIAKQAGRLIMTVENEVDNGKLKWPRSYERVFPDWQQTDWYSTEHWPPNTKANIARIFKKGAA